MVETLKIQEPNEYIGSYVKEEIFLKLYLYLT